MASPPLSVLEIFGLHPAHAVLAHGRRALLGSGKARPTEWGLSSVRIFKPSISLPTWLGRTRADRRVVLYNYFNRTPRRPGRPYSVRVTDCRDHRGGRFTYDSHNGTDFACPVGTPIVAAAPGVVVRVQNDLDMGGLKVCIDHGDGLFTTSNHLSRALVEVGAKVERGRTIALSGASGLEFVVAFPWVAPHLHFNTWLDGDPTDPFAVEGETALFRHGNDPRPFDGTVPDEDARFVPTEYDPDALEEAIAACVDPELRERMRSIPQIERRAAELMVLRNYQPDVFASRPRITRAAHERRARLDLPFRREDFVGVAFPA